MVIFVEYNIPKEYFLKHKKAIKRALNNLAFDIVLMKFEKGMTYREIAKKQKLTVWIVRQIISRSCEQLRLKGFRYKKMKEVV